MRIAFVVLSAAALAACIQTNRTIVTPARGPAQSETAWNITKSVDRISGKPAPTAYVLTVRTNYETRGKRSVWADDPVGLELKCFDSRPVVRMKYVARIGSNRSAIVEYRFDNQPGRKADARFLQDQRTVVIEDRAAVAEFVDELSSSKLLYLRVTSLYAGRTAAEFHVHGAPDAIATAFSECPPEPARSAVATQSDGGAEEQHRVRQFGGSYAIIAFTRVPVVMLPPHAE